MYFLEFELDDIAILGPPYSIILGIDDLAELREFIIEYFEGQDPMWYITAIRR